MTYPPNGSAAPPGRRHATPSVPPRRPCRAPGARRPPRRTAWAEGVDRLRAAATTEPGRLRIIGAVLAALVVAFGAVTAWQISDRAAAADDVAEQQPAAERGRRATSTARSPTPTPRRPAASWRAARSRRRRASGTSRTSTPRPSCWSTAAANTGARPPPRRRPSPKLNKLLPEYTGLVERARANNRQGFPLGGAYLRYANEKMQHAAAARGRAAVRRRRTERLGADYADAKPWPWVAIGARRGRARPRWAGPSGATTGGRTGCSTTVWSRATAAVHGGAAVAGRRPHRRPRRAERVRTTTGSQSLKVLNDARIASLQGPRQREPDAGRARRGDRRRGRRDEQDAYDVVRRATTSSGMSDRSPTEPRTGRERARRRRRGQGAGRGGRDGEHAEWQDRHKDGPRAPTTRATTRTRWTRSSAPRTSRPASASTAWTTELAKALAHEQREFKQAAERRARAR